MNNENLDENVLNLDDNKEDFEASSVSKEEGGDNKNKYIVLIFGLVLLLIVGVYVFITFLGNKGGVEELSEEERMQILYEVDLIESEGDHLSEEERTMVLEEVSEEESGVVYTEEERLEILDRISYE